jgi:hypothetical protein
VAKAPRFGDPRLAELLNVIVKLATDVSLDSADRAWLYELLEAVRNGEDVSKRFTRNAKPSPEAERHFWIACDVAQSIHDKQNEPYEAVAKRWRLDDADAKGPDNVRKIVQRQRANTAAIAHLLGNGFARVIAQRRDRLLGLN